MRIVSELPDYVPDYEMFDFESDDEDPDYREIYAYVDEDTGIFVLEGKQLHKIFDSTNFNDMESLRYFYKYIRNNGAVDELKELGLRDGDVVRVKNYEFIFEEE